MRGKLFLILLPGVCLSGCALLMPPNPYTKEMIDALANDDASACIRVNVTGGGAGMVTGPGVIPAGGYGSVGLTVGRTGPGGVQGYFRAGGPRPVRRQAKGIG